MLELWGGHECTVNRTRTGHKDQSRLSGHDARPEDLDLFASLGIKAIRYPVLWEREAPNAPDERDFSWSDERLARLRRHVDRLAPGHPSPIVPVVLGDEDRAVKASATLLEHGLLVPAIRPPTVAAGTSRLRVTLSAAHTDDQVDRLLAALALVTGA